MKLLSYMYTYIYEGGVKLISYQDLVIKLIHIQCDIDKSSSLDSSKNPPFSRIIQWVYERDQWLWYWPISRIMHYCEHGRQKHIQEGYLSYFLRTSDGAVLYWWQICNSNKVKKMKYVWPIWIYTKYLTLLENISICQQQY